MPARTALGDEDKVKGLIFGNPKQGKTTALAGFAKLGKTVAIDTEGMGWLRAPLQRHIGAEAMENIHKYPASSMEDMEDNYWKIMTMFDDPEVEDPFAVVVDHMTDLESRLVTAARTKRVGKVSKPLEKKAAGTGEAALVAAAALADLNVDLNERDDYGVWTNQAKKLLRLYRDLPCHVVFAAHYRTEGGVKVPSMTEKARIDYMGTMNLVLAYTKMTAGDTEAYVAYTTEAGGWYAGDRFGVLKPIIVNPSMDRIVKSIQGELDWDTDPAQLAFKAALTGDN